MRRDQFSYPLADDLIAQFPTEERDASRLLCVDAATNTFTDRVFSDLPELLNAGDLLVFNDTRVLPARLLATKESGGRIEIMLERVLDEHRLIAQVRGGKRLRAGSNVLLADGTRWRLEARTGDLYRFVVAGDARITVLEAVMRNGHTPLPPYIRRPDTGADRQRYQTVYAKTPGSVAAPTAGLHFTDALLDAIGARGINTAFVTLHVGAGTFRPVRVDMIEDHKMHRERLIVSNAVCDTVAATRAAGGRVVAVGTTTARCLEAAAAGGTLQAYDGETALFIYPGYQFRIVDALITNFHAPESTLLMLVAAFAGCNRVMNAYRHAIIKRYRFFSYGDAVFLQRGESDAV